MRLFSVSVSPFARRLISTKEGNRGPLPEGGETAFNASMTTDNRNVKKKEGSLVTDQLSVSRMGSSGDNMGEGLVVTV
ncbi:hypothetical protein E2542_SST18330 [Spatholobus suberectus]|nr:hypothetical protein E2542_SST18330 [Spatholobus suberectus]